MLGQNFGAGKTSRELYQDAILMTSSYRQKWMRAMEKDYTFQKVMETQKDLKDTDGFDWLESTKLAIDKRKFLLNRLFAKQPIPEDED